MNNDASKHDKGIALIAVLSILLLITLLSLTIVTVSKICSIRTHIDRLNERSMLLAEGASNRIFWLLLNDRKNFKTRVLGDVDYNKDESHERLMADGVTHEFDYYGGKVEYQLKDLQTGIQVSGPAARMGVNKLIDQPNIDAAKKNKLTNLANRLMDYVDADSLLRVNSLESNEYAALGLSPLPRNSIMQFREEVLYIPGAKDFFAVDKIGRLSSVALIAPNGLRQINVIRPNIFNSSKTTIARLANLSSDESDEVEQALKKWVSAKTPLSESLEATLLERLKQHFSFAESGYYTMIIRASANPAFRGLPLVVSMQVTNRIAFNGRNFYEWTIY